MRWKIVVALAGLGTALIAAGAYGDGKSVNDPRGDAFAPFPGVSASNADILTATAGHAGGRLKHTVTVAGRPQYVRLFISTDSDRECERSIGAIRGETNFKVDRCTNPRRTGSAMGEFHRHSVEISFSEQSIGGPRRYGWSARAFVLQGNAVVADDRVPNASGYIRHALR